MSDWNVIWRKLHARRKLVALRRTRKPLIMNS